MTNSISSSEFFAPPTQESICKLFLDELMDKMDIAFYGGLEEMNQVLNEMALLFPSYIDTDESPEMLLTNIRNAWGRLDKLKNSKDAEEDTEQVIVFDLLNAISAKGISNRYFGISE